MKRKSRIVAISVPAICILFGLFVYNNVYLGLQEKLKQTREERAAKTKTLIRYLGIIAEQPSVEKKILDFKEQRKADDSRMLDGRTPAVCAAALQETVKGIISARGGNISTEMVEKPEDDGAFRIISITVDASVPDTKALSDALYDIETRTPSLVVRVVDTRVKNLKEPRELDVRFKVSGLTAGK
jgi:hypothetical protein